MTLYIIIAFFVGSTLGAVVALFMSAAIHGRQKEDWRAEYRRLMGGINKACAGLHNTLRGHGYDGVTQACILNIKRDLNNLFNGEK